MILRRTIAFAIALLLAPCASLAQSTIPSGHLLGNSTAAERTPTDTTLSALFDRAFACTQGQIVNRGASLNSCTAAPILGLSGTLGSLSFGNATSGLVKIQPVTGVLGSSVLSLPAATDTLTGKATTDIFTNKTYDTAGTGNSFKINGQSITSVSGTGTQVAIVGALTNSTVPRWLAGVLSNGAISDDGTNIAVAGAASATAFSSGTNGVIGGSLTLNGSATGSSLVKVAAAAGSSTFQLPVGNGSSGQLLSTNGSGVTSWITASGTGTVTSVVCGSVTITSTGTCDNGVLLDTVTASSSASITGAVTFSGTYNRYQLVFSGILPATNAVGCRLRINSGGIQTTGYLAAIVFSTAAATPVASAPTTFINCSRSDTADVPNTGQGISGQVWIDAPSGTTAPKNIDVKFVYPSSANSITQLSGGGFWNGGNGAVTNWQVDFTSGNIASGTVRVYGWK